MPNIIKSQQNVPVLEQLKSSCMEKMMKIHQWICKDGFPEGKLSALAVLGMVILSYSIHAIYGWIYQSLQFELGYEPSTHVVLVFTLLSMFMGITLHSFADKRVKILALSAYILFICLIARIAYTQAIEGSVYGNAWSMVGMMVFYSFLEFISAQIVLLALSPIGLGWIWYLAAIPLAICYGICWLLVEIPKSFRLNKQEKKARLHQQWFEHNQQKKEKAEQEHQDWFEAQDMQKQKGDKEHQNWLELQEKKKQRQQVIFQRWTAFLEHADLRCQYKKQAHRETLLKTLREQRTHLLQSHHQAERSAQEIISSNMLATLQTILKMLKFRLRFSALFAPKEKVREARDMAIDLGFIHQLQTKISDSEKPSFRTMENNNGQAHFHQALQE